MYAPRPLKLIAACLGFLIWSTCALADVERKTPIEFQAAQLEYQYNQITKLSAMSAPKLLKDYGIDSVLVEELLFNLSHFTRGVFFKEDMQCASIEIKGIETQTSVSGKDRLALLEKHGPEILWAASEVTALKNAINNDDFSADAAERSKIAFREATCKRIESLVSSLSCLAKKPSTCPADLVASLKNEAIKIGGYESEILVVDRWNASIKTALHRYLPALLLNIKEKGLLYEELVVLAKNPQRGFDESVRITARIVKDTIIDQAYVSMYESYSLLPQETHDFLASNDSFQKLQTKASAALNKIQQANPVYKDQKVTIPTPITQKERRQAELDIREFVEELAATFIDTSYLDELRNNVNDQLVKPLKVTGDELCEALKTESAEDVWTSMMWGFKPTTDKPVGYRVVAKPTGHEMPVGRDMLPKYEARIELLLLVPDGAEYAQRKILDANGQQICSAKVRDTYSIFDLGVLIKEIYRDETNSNDVSKGFRIANTNLNNVISTTGIQRALEQIGLPGGFITGQADWTISNDFQEVTVDLPLLSGNVSFPIVSKGAFVFNPNRLGSELCSQIETAVAPSLIGNWRKDVALPIQGWSLDFTGSASESINIPHCDEFVEGKQVSGIPLPESRMMAEIDLSLKGTFEGNAFKWPISLTASVYPNKIKMKSAIFGNAPDVVTNYVEKKFNAHKAQFPKLSVPGWNYSIRVGSPAIKDNWASLIVPLSIEASSDNCAAKNLAGEFNLNSQTFTAKGASLSENLVDLATCEVERQVEEVIENNMPSCESISKPVFGMTRVKVASDPVTKTECKLTFEGEIAGKSITVAPVLAKFEAPDNWALDFSQVKITGELVESLRQTLASEMENFAPNRFELNVRNAKHGLLVDVTLLPSGPDDLIGEIEIGTLTISADGNHSFKTELKRVLKNRVAAVLEPKLEAIITRLAPEEFYITQVDIKYTNTLTVKVLFNILLKDSLLVPMSLTLLPTPDISIMLDEGFLRKLERYLASLIPLGGLVEVDPPTLNIDKSYNVTLITGIGIDLDALGQIKLKKIYISGKGVDLKGRLELRLDQSIPLTPAPAPIFLINPGVFYSFDSKQVGALGGLTIFAPSLDRVLQIDAELFTSDPDNFIKELGLSGELILMDSIPIIYTDGVLNFEDSSVNFKGRTSELFGKILSAKVAGELLAKDGKAELNSDLVLLGVKLSETKLAIDLKKCPNQCIEAEAFIKFLIGDATIEAKFGPFLVDALVKLGIELKIDGKEFGHAKLDASILRATLQAKILVFTLNVVTPKLNDMTPGYIASIIASLLKVDLAEVLDWLKNPKIEFAPAGKPASDGGGVSVGNGDSNNDGENEGNAGGSESATADSEPSGISGEGLKDLIAKSALPQNINAPAQRVTANKGKALAACRKHEDRYSWGHVYYRPYSDGWGYWGHTISKRVFEKICHTREGSGPWETHLSGVFTIRDDYLLLKTKAKYDRRALGESICRTEKGVYQCKTDKAVYDISLIKPEPDQQHYNRQMSVFGHRYSFVPEPASHPKKTELTLNERELKRLEKRFHLLKKPSDELSRKEKAQLNRLQNRLIYLIKRENGERVTRVNAANPLQKSRFFGWISSNTDYIIDYTYIEPSNPKYGRDYVKIWVNEDADDAVFGYFCYPEENFEPCYDLDPKDADKKAVDMIREAGITANSIPVLQDTATTAWVMNDAIPSILSGQEMPKLGRLIYPDLTVAQCAIKSIQLFDTAERRTFRYTTISEGGRKENVRDFNINKSGDHADWASLDDESVLTAMASFLACQDDANAWLDKHQLWLSPEENNVDNALLFSSKVLESKAPLHVTRIQPEKGIENLTVPSTDPYSRVRANPSPLSISKKQIMYRLMREVYDSQEVKLLLNTEENWEATLFYQKDVASNQTETISILLRALSQNNSLFETPLIVEAIKVKKSRFDECMTQLPTFDGDIFGYLKLKRPTIRTGVSPRYLINAIKHTSPANCTLN